MLMLGNSRPQKSLAANRIRADIVRFLLLGGDDLNPVHEDGVMVAGAWIEGTLNLAYARCPQGFIARACWFSEEIIAIEATIPTLRLSGSSVPSLAADGIRVAGDLFLRENFTATEGVRLLGAEIGGDLSCRGGIFTGVDECAINADRLRVRGGIFLNNGFAATGEVRMLGAEVGGVLSCIGGTFSNGTGDAFSADGINVAGGLFMSDGFSATGQVRLHGAKFDVLSCIGGTFTNKDAPALNLDGARIRGALFLRGSKIMGEINLATTFAGTLVDSQACYQNASLILDGFHYDRIVGSASATHRIEWLNRQFPAHLAADFKPQPWEQLILVLRNMGHPAEAAQVAMAKQEALRDAKQIGLRQPNPTFTGFRLVLDKGWSRFSNWLARALHSFYGWIAGYGHRPTRIVWRMLTVCAICSLAYYGGRHYGLMGPTAPMIQMHQSLTNCGTGGDQGAAHWTSPQCPMPPEYSTLQPFIYSLDVIIPFVDLHQESEWGPVVTNASGETLWWGRALRWLLWIEIVFGWIASVMFVGIISRLVDKD
jgi:hypothetical protein